jgi:hypothetical protein
VTSPSDSKHTELAQLRAKRLEIYTGASTVLTTTKELVDLLTRIDELERELKGEVVGQSGFDRLLAETILKYASQYPPSEVKKAHEVLGI